MGSDVKPLSELCDESRGITYGIVKVGDFIEGGIPVIRGGDIRDNRIVFDDSKRVSEEVSQTHKRTILQGGEIIINLISDPGHTAIVPSEFAGYNVSRDVAVIPLLDTVSHPYVNYLLKSPQAVAWFDARLQGSVTQKINLSTLKEYPVPLPPLPEQKAIAHILGTLDDKIELNRRMNATLEGMGQALFKSWFVEFDPVIDNALAAGNPIPEEFAARAELRRTALKQGAANRDIAQHFPDAFEETDELGWIPHGWKVKDIENTTSTIIDHRGKTPKKLGSDWREVGYPAVSAKNIKDGRLVRKDTIRFADEALYKRWMPEELMRGDVLMTSEAPLGETFYLAEEHKWVLSQRLFALRSVEPLSGVYLYFWLRTEAATADIDGRASGTTVQGIRQSELRQVRVLTPTSGCICKFSETVDLLMKKRAKLELEGDQLVKIRDTLLPKLISGELPLREAEQIASHADP